jgi:hypothetical protein
MIELRGLCRTAGCGKAWRVAVNSSNHKITCPACSAVITVGPAGAWAPGDRVSFCPVCEGREFFVRKDFPQRAGLSVVGFAAVASCYFIYTRQVIWAWMVLAAAVVIDALLYWLTGRVTVCYRCRVEFRGVVYNPEHKGFDLATSEKYG